MKITETAESAEHTPKSKLIFLSCSFLVLFGIAYACTTFAYAMPANCVLGFHNLHTNETVRLSYRKDGKLVNSSLEQFSQLLRDHRRNETTEIDPRLFDLLFQLKNKVGSDANFEVISGYRSAATNAQLAAAGRNVASKSLHMRGIAIDIRLPGVPIEQLHAAAKELKRGGVGLYRKNDFIHVDLGRVRYW